MSVPSTLIEVPFVLGGEHSTRPVRASDGAAAFDLCAAESTYLSMTNARAVVGTGLSVAIPPDYVGLVCSRSGLAAKHGVFVLNAPGVIDSDYRGEIKIILGYQPLNYMWPETTSNFMIEKGMRLAQLLVVPAPLVGFVPASSLSYTLRADGGLGSTGV